MSSSLKTAFLTLTANLSANTKSSTGAIDCKGIIYLILEQSPVQFPAESLSCQQ